MRIHLQVQANIQSCRYKKYNRDHKLHIRYIAQKHTEVKRQKWETSRKRKGEQETSGRWKQEQKGKGKQEGFPLHTPSACVLISDC